MLLLSWNTRTDELVPGQWLKGRIYEERCDLSPSGELFLYFAANYRLPFYSWTALSRPPWLTALALWPKGDTWGGGGRFESDERVFLDHGAQPALAPGFRLPRGFRVGSSSAQSPPRASETGWRRVQTGAFRDAPPGTPQRYLLTPPDVRQRPRPGKDASPLELQERLTAVHEVNGPWKVFEYSLVGSSRRKSHELGRLDWADWDRQGDLLYAREGRLYRVRAGKVWNAKATKQVADLRPLTFEPRVAPDEATHW